MPPDLSLEKQWWETGALRIAGVDEVWRGCLAGPVVAAAVIVSPELKPVSGVRDSKKLSPRRRLLLYGQIRSAGHHIALGAATVAEIEQHNILVATHIAMARALEKLEYYDHILVDGSPIRDGRLGEHTAIVGGDDSSYSIACASIVAKVVRDYLMRRLARSYPGYGWETNAGYGTRVHLAGLQQHGVTPHHRQTFAPVRARLQRGE